MSKVKKKQISTPKVKVQKSGISKIQFSNYLWLLPILLATLIAFLPAFKNSFTNFDDPVYVIENPYIYGLTWANMVKIFSEFYYGGYYPFTLFSFALDYSIGGMDPFIFHFTNIILHLFNTAFVFWLIHKLFKNIQISIITAFLFGIHPMHVESVAWISERKDVLYAFFFFLSLIAYLFYLDKKEKKFYIFSLFLFLFSVLSKTMAVSLVLCLFAFDWLKERDLKSKDALIEKIPFVLIAIVFGVINILSQKSIGAIDAENTLPLLYRFVFACYAFCMYLVKLIFPTGLSAIYPFPVSTGDMLPLFYWLFLIPVALIVYAFFRFYRKYKLYAFAFLFFVFNIVLVLQLLQLNDFVMADRFVYVASAGFFLFLAFLFKDLLIKYASQKSTLYIILSLYALFLIIQTSKQNKIWKDSITLWDNVLDKYPDIYRALDKRGQAKSDIGEFNEAMLDFNKSIEIDSNYYSVYINRGFARNMLGENEKAMEDYNKAISLNPEYYMAYNNRGTTKANLGKLEEAIDDFTKAISLNPMHVKAYTNRGLAYMSLEKLDRAMKDYNYAIKLNPEYYPTYNFRGMLLAKNKKLDEALKDFDQCLKLFPDYPDALFNRGVVRLQLNQKQSGCQDLSKAASLGYERAYPMLKMYCN